MRWKKIADSDEVLIFEKKISHGSVRIEARNLDEGWQIIKKYDIKDEDYVEEYFAESLDERNKILLTILEQPDLSYEQISLLRMEQRKKIVMNLERIYKESNIEKWVFSVNGNVVKNFVIVRFNGSTTMDIVLSDDYRHLEKQIVRELLKSLGINEDKECFYGVYFYTKKRNYLIEDEISSSIKTKLDSE